MSLNDYIEKKPTLETKRLRLRVMTKADIVDLKEWMPNKRLYEYWGKSLGKTDKDPSLLFVTPEKPTKSFHLGIALKQPDKIIGELWVYLIENDRMAKVAIRISEDFHGNGYASEALSEIVRFCFTETELKRLWTDVDIRNTASIRMLERCGFTREGLIRGGKMVSSWCDYYIYGILKEDFLRGNEK